MTRWFELSEFEKDMMVGVKQMKHSVSEMLHNHWFMVPLMYHKYLMEKRSGRSCVPKFRDQRRHAGSDNIHIQWITFVYGLILRMTISNHRPRVDLFMYACKYISINIDHQSSVTRVIKSEKAKYKNKAKPTLCQKKSFFMYSHFAKRTYVADIDIQGDFSLVIKKHVSFTYDFYLVFYLQWKVTHSFKP